MTLIPDGRRREEPVFTGPSMLRRSMRLPAAIEKRRFEGGVAITIGRVHAFHPLGGENPGLALSANALPRAPVRRFERALVRPFKHRKRRYHSGSQCCEGGERRFPSGPNRRTWDSCIALSAEPPEMEQRGAEVKKTNMWASRLIAE